jgi:hypothetical protein
MPANAKTTSSGTANNSDAGNQISTNLGSADSAAAQRLQTLGWVHQTPAAQLTRTAATLQAQYGSNDSGVQAAQAAAAAANTDAARAAVVQQQATTPEPNVAAKGWALQGRVFDAQLSPVSGYTVFLVDSAKSYQQAYGFAYSDSTGYFLLNYPGSEAKAKASVTAKQSSATPELYVAVVDKKAQPVYLSAASFQPAVGSAIYQNITVFGGQQPIGDPSPEIRNVAFPKSSSSKRKAKG